MSDFQLSKWYADCITEEGDALILYSAELRWRRLPTHYTSLLTRYHGRPVRSCFSLRQQPPPLAQEGCVVWRSRTWNVEACWREPGRAVREILFDSPAGALDWHCVAPRGAAELRVGRDEFYRGWGYVEHLQLSLPPWRLPISRLR